MREPPQSGRPARRSRDEIRALMLQAGLAILVEQGLGVGAEELTFKKVLDRVESSSGVRLTNASVIRRVWENQAEFQDDVLLAVARAGDTGGEMGDTAAALVPLFEAIDLSSPAGRLRGLSEVCRVGGAASLRTLVDSRNWSLWVGVWVLAVTGPPSERGRRIRQALIDGYESTTDAWAELYASMASYLGLRVRAPFTLRQLTVSVGALVEGCALREGAERDTAAIVRPTGPGGGLEEWTLFGVGLEALALQYLEPDPDWTGPVTTA
ncbi:MAG TPA: hypothetical protein VND44_11205 [Acidimicrobiales bacterium]|nr:hypothetical protein [Acidimicrobiales bacterium]